MDNIKLVDICKIMSNYNCDKCALYKEPCIDNNGKLLGVTNETTISDLYRMLDIINDCCNRHNKE